MSLRSPAVEIAFRTDPGRDPDKHVNEDAAIHLETTHGLLAVVCDGMGGHAGGKEASNLAVKTIVEIIEAAPAATPAGAALKRAVEEANARVWSMPTMEAGFRPGSTVVAILVHTDGIEIAHVGDSRLYLCHAGAVSQVTRDHSMVQEMVDRNLIRAEDAAKHPDANKILRALGIAKEVEVELRPESLPYVMGDVLVLCSDGLSDLVEPAEILEIAGSHPCAQAAGQLVDLANARGGHDNITALIIRMKANATTREAPALMKTMPLTAHEAPLNVDHGSGPTGTLVSAPLVAPPPNAGGGGAPAAPVPAAGAPPPLAAYPSAPNIPVALSSPVIPVAPPPPASRPSHAAGSRRTPMVILGVVLAVAAVAIVGAIVVVAMTPEHHKTVPLIAQQGREASTPTSPDDLDAETRIVPAPPLNPPQTLLPKSDGGGFWDPCASLQRAKERNAPATQLANLDAKCRQAGGNPPPLPPPAPIPTNPNPNPTPNPTPVPTPTPRPPG